MDFEPKTEIWFLRTGIDSQNKVVAKTQSELLSLLTREGNVQGRTVSNSFQRADGYFSIRVDHSDIPYYGLLQSDTVLYKNEETTGAFWIVGNILAVEWANPNCSFVRFSIDSFMTYQSMIDWDKTFAYVEREHVKEDWASDGGNPLFSNIGPAEEFGTVPDTPLYSWNKGWECDKVVVISPYNESGEPTFEGKNVHGLYSSLNTQVMTPEEANEFFSTIAENKDTSINNINGVYGIPSEFEAAISGRGMTPDIVENLQSINSAVFSSANMPKFNNAKTLSGPFMVLKLYSSSGDSITINPQWFGSDVDEYELHICAAGAGGLIGGIAAAFNNKNGTFDWRTYNDFMVKIQQLPSCPHTLDGFADWQSINGMAVAMRSLAVMSNGVTGVVTSGVRGANTYGSAEASGMGPAGLSNLAAGAALNVVNGSLSMGTQLAQIGANIRQARASGATISGMENNTAIFDLGLSSFGKENGWGFKVIYYTAQPYILNSIDSFFDRFGYCVNKIKQLGIENRPIWSFVKTAECHVAASTGIPYMHELAINAMFNRGVTMWRGDKYASGQKIGDFSDTKGNRGIRGA